MEGLDDCDSLDSEDDSQDDSPHASDASFPSGSRCNENAGNSSACSSSSVELAEDSPATGATEKPLEQPECSGRDLQGETSTSGQPEIPAEGNSTMAKPLKEEAQEKNEVAQAPKEEEQESVSPKAQETNQLQSTVSMKQYKMCHVFFFGCFYSITLPFVDDIKGEGICIYDFSALDACA